MLHDVKPSASAAIIVATLRICQPKATDSAEAKTGIVFFDYQSRKVQKMPQKFAEKFGAGK